MALTERLQILLETIGGRKVVSDFDKVGSAAGRLDTSTRGANSGLTSLSAVALSAGTVLKGAAIAGVGVATKQLIDFGAATIDAASRFEEASNKSAVVFGQNATIVTEWARQAATDFGLSQTAATEAAGTFGNMFAAMGVGAQTSLEMSQSIVELASDLASFNNIPIPDVLDRLRSGLLGEQEAVERLGINMSQTRLKAVALSMGLGDGVSLLDANAKAMAAYSIILQDSTNAQGDFDRTSGALANQQRILTANWENMQAELGQKLLPVMTQVVSWLNSDGIPAFVGFAEVMGESVVDAIAFTIGALADFMSVTGRALEKIDQFVPGMEGVPEAAMEMAAEMRHTEADMHDFHVELDGLADTTVDAGSALSVTSGQLAKFGDTVGFVAEETTSAVDSMVSLKDAQFALTDAQRSSEDATRRLADSQDEYNALLVTGGIDLDAIATAQDRLTEAQQESADAAAEVVKWQEKVNEALKPADVKTKAKADRDLAAAEDEVTQAGINLRNAQEDLLNINVGGRATADEYRQAQLRIRDAERAVAEATDALAAEELAHGQVMVQGTTITDAYKEATEGLKTAEELATVAKQAEKVAQDELTAAQAVAPEFAAALAEAELKVADAEWAVEKAAWAAQKAQIAFNETVADDKKAKVNAMTESVNALAEAFGGLPTEPIQLVSPDFMGPLSGNQRYAPTGGGGGLGGMLNQTRNMALQGGMLTIQLTVDGKVLTEIVHNGLLAKQRTGGSLGIRAS